MKEFVFGEKVAKAMLEACIIGERAKTKPIINLVATACYEVHFSVAEPWTERWLSMVGRLFGVYWLRSGGVDPDNHKELLARITEVVVRTGWQLDPPALVRERARIHAEAAAPITY